MEIFYVIFIVSVKIFHLKPKSLQILILLYLYQRNRVTENSSFSAIYIDNTTKNII